MINLDGMKEEDIVKLAELLKENNWMYKYIDGEQITVNPIVEKIIQLAKVYKNPYEIKNIENPSEEVKLEAVKQNGWTIQFIKNPTEEMKLIGVRDNGYNIKHIENPSEEVKLEAVKQNGWTIQFI